MASKHFEVVLQTIFANLAYLKELAFATVPDFLLAKVAFDFL